MVAAVNSSGDNNFLTPITPQVKEFVPKGIDCPESLSEFRAIVGKYLDSVDSDVKDARSALNSNTLITDSKTLRVIGSAISEADNLLEKARDLYDKNYLYSAANYAFLAATSANSARQILLHPSILTPNSSYMSQLIDSTQESVVDTLQRLNNTPLTSKNLDLLVFARQRLVWAQNVLHSLTSGVQTTIIVNNRVVSGSSTFDTLQDVMHAQEWVTIANSIVDSVDSSGAPVDASVLEADAQAAKVDLEDALSVHGCVVSRLSASCGDKFQNSDLIIRYSECAETAYDQKWYATSLYCASVANSALQLEKYNLTDINVASAPSVLSSALNESSDTILASKSTNAIVFWQHARFFKQAGDYYVQYSRTDAAKDAYSTAYLLGKVSYDLADTVLDIRSKLGVSSTEENNSTTLPFAYTMLTFIALAAFLILFVSQALLIHGFENRHKVLSEINKIKQTHSKKKELLTRKEILDRILMYEHALSAAREEHRKHLITDVEYNHISARYKARISELRAKEAELNGK